jgi:hypothetical protein
MGIRTPEGSVLNTRQMGKSAAAQDFIRYASQLTRNDRLQGFRADCHAGVSVVGIRKADF